MHGLLPRFFLRAVCRSLAPLGSLATSSRSTPPALFGCCGICVFLPPAPLPPIPPCRALSRRGPMACHGEGAGAQALTEPRRDYLARLPGGRKTPQQPAGGVEEVAPQWCGTQPTVKDRSTNSGAQRLAGGVGARSHHTARAPPGPRAAAAAVRARASQYGRRAGAGWRPQAAR